MRDLELPFSPWASEKRTNTECAKCCWSGRTCTCRQGYGCLWREQRHTVLCSILLERSECNSLVHSKPPSYHLVACLSTASSPFGFAASSSLELTPFSLLEAPKSCSQSRYIWYVSPRALQVLWPRVRCALSRQWSLKARRAPKLPGGAGRGVLSVSWVRVREVELSAVKRGVNFRPLACSSYYSPSSTSIAPKAKR